MPNNPNEKLLLSAVEKLEPLFDRIVFVGGCVTGLLVSDPAAAPIRSTLDVDVIVELTSKFGFNLTDHLPQAPQDPGISGTPIRSGFHRDVVTASSSYTELLKLEEQMRKLGFRESQEEGAPRCRWLSDDLILDVMPTDPAILGFSNRWYPPALENAQWFDIGQHRIRIINAPYFLATKLEAFHNRGKDDMQVSHDLEDVITVIDGRPELLSEISTSPRELRQYLAEELKNLLSNTHFLDAVPGYLLPDSASQQRISIVLNRIQQIVEANG